MADIKTIERLSKKYLVSPSEFIKRGSSLAIEEKKRNLKIEKLEILSRYEVLTVNELERKIKNGEVLEHPGWEDFIELKNIETEIRELDRDIKTLQEA